MDYRKKPVVIQALQFNGTNHDAVADFCAPQPIRVGGNYTLVIPTLEGDHIASEGDFIIRGVKGELYPCKPDIFEATYDRFENNVGMAPSTGLDFGLDFGLALSRLKAGYKLRRADWNGKGMYIVRQPGYPEGIGANANTAKALGIPEGQIVKTRPYLAMMDAQGMLVTGWLASQTDILAEDWEIAK